MILLKTEKMLAHKDQHVGRIVFNNPARHNAVSLEGGAWPMPHKRLRPTPTFAW